MGYTTHYRRPQAVLKYQFDSRQTGILRLHRAEGSKNPLPMNAFAAVKNYLVGSYAEMKKVTWPTKEQTFNYSFLVVAMSIGLAIFFAVLDYIFNLGIGQLLTK